MMISPPDAMKTSVIVGDGKGLTVICSVTLGPGVAVSVTGVSEVTLATITSKFTVFCPVRTYTTGGTFTAGSLLVSGTARFEAAYESSQTLAPFGDPFPYTELPSLSSTCVTTGGWTVMLPCREYPSRVAVTVTVLLAATGPVLASASWE